MGQRHFKWEGKGIARVMLQEWGGAWGRESNGKHHQSAMERPQCSLLPCWPFPPTKEIGEVKCASCDNRTRKKLEQVCNVWFLSPLWPHPPALTVQLWDNHLGLWGRLPWLVRFEWGIFVWAATFLHHGHWPVLLSVFSTLSSECTQWLSSSPLCPQGLAHSLACRDAQQYLFSWTKMRLSILNKSGVPSTYGLLETPLIFQNSALWGTTSRKQSLMPPYWDRLPIVSLGSPVYTSSIPAAHGLFYLLTRLCLLSKQ